MEKRWIAFAFVGLVALLCLMAYFVEPVSPEIEHPAIQIAKKEAENRGLKVTRVVRQVRFDQSAHQGEKSWLVALEVIPRKGLGVL